MLRKLRFSNEGGTESQVRCKVDPTCNMNSRLDDCGCPCEYQAGQPLNAAYMRTIESILHPKLESNLERDLLMIGLGGGEMVQSFLFASTSASITAVELSPDVIEVAKHAFGLARTQEKFPGRLKLLNQDSMIALSSMTEDSYDAVVVDCFKGKGEVPESCRSEAFAKEVLRVLKPGGTFLQNMWSFSWESQAVYKDFDASLALYKRVFPAGVQVNKVPMPAMIDFVRILQTEKPLD